MLIPNRHGSTDSYRYGFQGQEKDDEIKGEGNSINYKYRMHDPRVGRFFATDPLTRRFAWNSPYAFSENRVIDMVEFEGLEATTTIKNGVYFVKLENVDISYVIRKSEEYFTDAAIKANQSSKDDYTVNLQLYETTSDSYYARAKYGAARNPQPSADYRGQGFIVDAQERITGRTSELTFYFAQDNNVCGWTCGQGNVPSDTYSGFGGGIPLYVDGLKYGEKNIYKKGSPKGLPEFGSPGEDNEKYLLQRSNRGWNKQAAKGVGKTVIGYNSVTDQWILVVQQQGAEGLSLYEIRDELISQGYDSILSFDGSTSSTLVNEEEILASPNGRKNSTIPTGATFSVPEKKEEKN